MGAPSAEKFPLRHIAIEGPIGVGKTSLAGLLAKRFSGTQVLEDVKNPFLPEFYEGRKGAAFQTQVFFLLSRFGQQQEIAQMDLFKELVIADYMFAKDKIFANLTLSDEEMRVYEKVWGPLSDSFGRKRPLYAGTALFVAGSIACALAGSIDALIGYRLDHGH